MNNNKIILFLCTTLCLFTLSCNQLATSGTDREDKHQITVKDALGEQVTLGKAAQRIVCLYEPGLDALYMLHADSNLIGIYHEVYTSDIYPFYAKLDSRIAEKKLPSTGTNHGAHIEHVIQLAPDLVIAHAAQEDMVKALRNAGIQVYAVHANVQEEVLKTVQDISILTGTEERGAELISYVQHEVETMKKRTHGMKNQKRVYFTWAYGRVFSTTGTKSMMHTCLEMAGVTNVCPFEVDQPNINAETLIKWDPDMIVMWNDSPSLFYDRQEFRQIGAVKNKQIFNLVPMFLYNPHTLKALCTASAIHQWAYPEAHTNAKQSVEKTLTRLYGKDHAEKIITLW